MTHLRVFVQPIVLHCLPHIPSISYFLFGSFSSVETGIHSVKGAHLIYSHEVIQRFSHISFNSLKTPTSPPHDGIHSQRLEFFICHLASDLIGGFSDKAISWLLAQQWHDRNVLTLYWHFPWSPAPKEAQLNVIHHRIHNIISSFKCGLQSDNMPSELEIAMESLIKVFHRYASKEGRSGTLSRRELRELMENELTNFLRVWTGAEPGQVTCAAAANASCACLSLRRTPLRSIRSWGTWTPTATARWILKSSCLWLSDCPSLVSSAIRRTWGRAGGCKASRPLNTLKKFVPVHVCLNLQFSLKFFSP